MEADRCHSLLVRLVRSQSCSGWFTNSFSWFTPAPRRACAPPGCSSPDLTELPPIGVYDAGVFSLHFYPPFPPHWGMSGAYLMRTGCAGTIASPAPTSGHQQTTIIKIRVIRGRCICGGSLNWIAQPTGRADKPRGLFCFVKPDSRGRALDRDSGSYSRWSVVFPDRRAG